MVDRQTERTPGILIKRNPNPQPVLELNPVLCSDSRFKGGMDRVLLNFQTILSLLSFISTLFELYQLTLFFIHVH